MFIFFPLLFSFFLSPLLLDNGYWRPKKNFATNDDYLFIRKQTIIVIRKKNQLNQPTTSYTATLLISTITIMVLGSNASVKSVHKIWSFLTILYFIGNYKSPLSVAYLGVPRAPHDHCHRHNPDLPDDGEVVRQTNHPRHGNRFQRVLGNVPDHFVANTRLIKFWQRQLRV